MAERIDACVSGLDPVFYDLQFTIKEPSDPAFAPGILSRNDLLQKYNNAAKKPAPNPTPAPAPAPAPAQSSNVVLPPGERYAQRDPPQQAGYSSTNGTSSQPAASSSSSSSAASQNNSTTNHSSSSSQPQPVVQSVFAQRTQSAFGNTSDLPGAPGGTSSVIPQPPKNIERKSGWLTKQGGRLKNWKKRWCVLKVGPESSLTYFEKEKEKMTEKGEIGLAASGIRPVSAKEFAFEIYREGNVAMTGNHDTYVLCAASQHEMNDWIHEIRLAIDACKESDSTNIGHTGKAQSTQARKKPTGPLLASYFLFHASILFENAGYWIQEHPADLLEEMTALFTKDIQPGAEKYQEITLAFLSTQHDLLVNLIKGSPIELLSSEMIIMLLNYFKKNTAEEKLDWKKIEYIPDRLLNKVPGQAYGGGGGGGSRGGNAAAMDALSRPIDDDHRQLNHATLSRAGKRPPSKR